VVGSLEVTLSWWTQFSSLEVVASLVVDLTTWGLYRNSVTGIQFPSPKESSRHQNSSPHDNQPLDRRFPFPPPASFSLDVTHHQHNPRLKTFRINIFAFNILCLLERQPRRRRRAVVLRTFVLFRRARAAKVFRVRGCWEGTHEVKAKAAAEGVWGGEFFFLARWLSCFGVSGWRWAMC
jgi:hypothetical protein